MENRRLSWRQRGELWLRLGLRLLLAALAVWLAARLGRTALALLTPFLLALGTAAALNHMESEADTMRFRVNIIAWQSGNENIFSR